MDTVKILGHTYQANQLCIVCTHIFLGADIYEIAHDNDDVIQVMCSRHPHLAEDALPVSAGVVSNLLSAARDNLTIPPNHYATRSSDGWLVRRCEG